MGAFGSFTLTNKGRTLQSKAQAGSKLNYTRIAVGSGQLGGQSILLLNGLIDQKKSLPVTRLRMQPPNKAIIGTVLSNQDVTTGFYFREIGVFAQDPDEGEILYCYTNAGTDAEYIPAVGGSNVIEKTIDCIVVIGTASNVSATIDDSLVFTRESEFNAKFDASGGHKHTGAAGDGPKITAAGLAAGAANDVAIGDRTADPATGTAYGLKGSITQWFSWLTKYLKAITGKANPFDTPDITLAATKTHVDDTTRHITSAERTAWNAAESNAKNASIPKTEKGVAGGVATLDAAKLMLADGSMLNGRVVERVFNFSFANGVANQKIDVIFPVNGGIYEIEVIGSFNTVNTAGKLVKRFNGTYSTPASYLTGTQYTEVTGAVKNHISIGEPFFDTELSKWRVPLESRTTAPNPFTVIARVISGSQSLASSPAISAVYTGSATTLPVAVQVIPDDTETQSGYKIQKHQLTDNSGKVIRLAPSTDLNTVNRNGQYDGYPLINAPSNNTGAWFFIEVFAHSQNPDNIFFQRATTFATVPRSYIRECYNSVWGEWIEEENVGRKNIANGYAGLDANALLPDARISGNIARISQQVPASTDLNEFRNEGDYFCPSNATAATILNMPTAIAGQSFYLRNNRHAGANQTIVSYNSTTFKIYTRNFYSSANPQWSPWQEIETSASKNVANGYAGLDSSAKVARVNTYNSLSGTDSGVPNLDTLYTAGVHPVANNAIGAPETGYGQVLIHVSAGETHNNLNNWIWQMWFGVTGGTWVRQKVNNGIWQPWGKLWTGKNDSDLFVSRPLIANNADYNTIVTNGAYTIYQPTGTTNAPPVNYGLLIVSKGDTSTNYAKQEVVEVTTGITYSRTRSGAGNVWTPWVINVTSDKRNVANGYAGLDLGAFVNPANLPYGGVINLLADSGRFMGTDGDPRSLQLTTSFANNSFFAPYNGTTVTSGGRFYHDNSTNGGTNGALTEDVTSLLTATGLGGSRYGTEFYIASYTMGSGVGNQGTVAGTYLMTVNNNFPAGGVDKLFTVSFWIRVKSGKNAIITKEARLRKNGVTMSGSITLTPADGWVHIEKTIPSSNGYSNAAPNIFATSGDVVQIAMPVVVPGAMGVGVHISPVMGSSLGFVPLPATSYTAADILLKLLTVDGVGSGLDADLHAGKNMGEIANGTLTYAGLTKGTAPALTASIAGGVITSLIAGDRISFKAHAATTGPVTLNVNGLGAKSIKKPNGNNPPLALGGVYTVVYDGTAFILQGEGGEYGTATAADVIAGKTIGTESGLVTGTIPLRTSLNGVNGTDNHDATQMYVGALTGGDSNTYVYLKPNPTDGSRVAYEGALWLRYKENNLNPANYLQGKPMFGRDGAIEQRSMHTSGASLYWEGGSNTLYGRIPFGAYLTPVAGMANPEVTFSRAQMVAAEPTLNGANIRAGTAIFGTAGSLQPWVGGLTSVDFSTQAGAEGRTEEMFRFPAGFTIGSFAGSILFGTSNNNSHQDHSIVLQDIHGNRLVLIRHFVDGWSMSTTQQATGLIVDKRSRRITMPSSQYMQGFGHDGDIAADGSFSKPFNMDGEVMLVHVVVASLGGGFSTASARGAAVWN